ncbi:MAG: cyclic nucleotide-binding domain-containing protein [Pseudomonadota bacterium]
MFDLTNGAAILVHIAALFYVAGFLVRDQLTLRMLILLGTVCYLIYYYFALDTPLWDAIIWSVIMGCANLYMILVLAYERTTFRMTDDEKRLFAAFDTMTPGEFRRVLKVAEWVDSDGTQTLTEEGKSCDRLYYVLDGAVTIEKAERKFEIPSGSFIGEVAYFLKQSASATVSVAKGGRYVALPREKIAALEKKYPGIRIAIHSVLSADMAQKVARS